MCKQTEAIELHNYSKVRACCGLPQSFCACEDYTQAHSEFVEFSEFIGLELTEEDKVPLRPRDTVGLGLDESKPKAEEREAHTTLIDIYAVYVQSKRQAISAVEKMKRLGFKFPFEVEEFNCFYVATQATSTSDHTQRKFCSWCPTEEGDQIKGLEYILMSFEGFIRM